jgi:hypothetical protein
MRFLHHRSAKQRYHAIAQGLLHAAPILLYLH